MIEQAMMTNDHRYYELTLFRRCIALILVEGHRGIRDKNLQKIELVNAFNKKDRPDLLRQIDIIPYQIV
jgi:hypothetical protein